MAIGLRCIVCNDWVVPEHLDRPSEWVICRDCELVAGNPDDTRRGGGAVPKGIEDSPP